MSVIKKGFCVDVTVFLGKINKSESKLHGYEKH